MSLPRSILAASFTTHRLIKAMIGAGIAVGAGSLLYRQHQSSSKSNDLQKINFSEQPSITFPINREQPQLPITINEVAIAFDMHPNQIKRIRRGFGGVGYEILLHPSPSNDATMRNILEILKRYRLENDICLRIIDGHLELITDWDVREGDEYFINFVKDRIELLNNYKLTRPG